MFHRHVEAIILDKKSGPLFKCHTSFPHMGLKKQKDKSVNTVLILEIWQISATVLPIIFSNAEPPVYIFSDALLPEIF